MANELSRWHPLDDIRQMQRVMDRFWGLPRLSREDIELASMDEALPVDVFEQDNNVVVKAALPGLKADDIKIDIDQGVLHIEAETRAEQDVNEGDYHRREYRYGRYSRSLRLPLNLDTGNANATYQDGILRLTFPKTEAAKASRIQVQVK